MHPSNKLHRRHVELRIVECLRRSRNAEQSLYITVALLLDDELALPAVCAARNGHRHDR
jgi:hypothetical protein